MKNFGILLLLGLATASCAKERLEQESGEKINEQEIKYRLSEPISFSMDESNETIVDLINDFANDFQTNENYVRVEPNLEENTATMSIETFEGGVPDTPSDPFPGIVVECGADGNDQAARRGCDHWAVDLMRNHGCCMISYGYEGEDGECYSVKLDCP